MLSWKLTVKNEEDITITFKKSGMTTELWHKYFHLNIIEYILTSYYLMDLIVLGSAELQVRFSKMITMKSLPVSAWSHLIMHKFTLINLTDRCHRSSRKLNQHFKFSGWFSSNLQFYSKSISDPSSLASLHFLSPIFFSFIIFLLFSMFGTPTHCRSL